MRRGGCWIFLSHSSKDIAKVRQIRNEFEHQGHNPLAFHLLCLNTDTEEGRNELDNLIKREIDAREWFVFCDSEYAENSQYVRMEKEYIVSQGKKKIWHLDMSLPQDELIEKVKEICSRLKIFLSYDCADEPLCSVLINELIKEDYDVWTSRDVELNNMRFNTSYSNFKSEIIANYGFYIAIISENFLESPKCMEELQKMDAQDTMMILLLIGDAEEPKLQFKSRSFRIPDTTVEQDMVLVAKLIVAETRRKMSSLLKISGEVEDAISQIEEELNHEGRYHSEDPVYIKDLGALEDYCTVYRFPCCGKYVLSDSRKVSRFRHDGCCK